LAVRRGIKRRSAAGGIVFRKRPPVLRYWRNIAPFIRKRSKDFPEENLWNREQNWALVLQAKAIPYKYIDETPLRSLFVPPVAARAAVYEIVSFEGEKPLPPLPKPVHEKYSHLYGCIVFLLIFWHRMRFYATESLPSLPQKTEAWTAAAGLDAYKITTLHEWWRSVTALTLHADAAHLMSNVALGLIFGIFLCAHTGLGLGVLLIILGGALGNTATAYLKSASSLSIGFSTAVFATIGLLAGIAAAKTARHILEHKEKDRKKIALKSGMVKSLPSLAEALGLLAMFGGSDAPNVDYLAHVMGLFSGKALGLAVGFLAPGLLDLAGKKISRCNGAPLPLPQRLLPGAGFAHPAYSEPLGWPVPVLTGLRHSPPKAAANPRERCPPSARARKSGFRRTGGVQRKRGRVFRARFPFCSPETLRRFRSD
jgi:membrane associated rhomboid family serine protease